jgi:hypothetical protein
MSVTNSKQGSGNLIRNDKKGNKTLQQSKVQQVFKGTMGTMVFGRETIL